MNELKKIDRTLTGCKVDIVLPVYNALTYVVDCLDSLKKYTHSASYNLFVINDASDECTTKYLEDIKDKADNIFIITNNENIGYLKSCNKGMNIGTAPYVLLLNSDVLVVENWLGRLIACMESDENIASVNPITNKAANINVPIAPGASYLGMDWCVKNITKNSYPDVVTGVGFCMMLRRSILNKIGLFDEIYGHGYCEESDLCMRFTTSGYRTVVADNVYVYHKGSASFINRDSRYLKNRKIFDQRWKKIYKKQFRVYKKADPLKYIRDYLSPQQRWSPLNSMRVTYRGIRSCYRENKYISLARELFRGIKDLPIASEGVVDNCYLKKITRPDTTKVTYVLHTIAITGGVLSVIQLVNELILLGVEARIVALYKYPEIDQWKLFTQPIIYRNEQELIDNFPESDIVVATHWTTVAWASEVVKLKKAKVSSYFIQDYEAWFYPEADIKHRKLVKETYKYIQNKIVKSEWLQRLLENDGFESTKIWLGMDLGRFYSRDVRKSNKIVVMAMARPATPHRGFANLIAALTKVRLEENVDVIFFGEEISSRQIPFDFINKGVISNQEELAKLYSLADVFVDASDFQGFGRTALEAMACNTACVLTNVGGVNEYAVNEVNCLLVKPNSPELLAEAILKLIRNTDLLGSIKKEGLSTAQNFCHKREAKETLQYFNKLLSKE